jgi:hypothetical protein
VRENKLIYLLTHACATSRSCCQPIFLHLVAPIPRHNATGRDAQRLLLYFLSHAIARCADGGGGTLAARHKIKHDIALPSSSSSSDPSTRVFLFAEEPLLLLLLNEPPPDACEDMGVPEGVKVSLAFGKPAFLFGVATALGRPGPTALPTLLSRRNWRNLRMFATSGEASSMMVSSGTSPDWQSSSKVARLLSTTHVVSIRNCLFNEKNRSSRNKGPIAYHQQQKNRSRIRHDSHIGYLLAIKPFCLHGDGIQKGGARCIPLFHNPLNSTKHIIINILAPQL